MSLVIVACSRRSYKEGVGEGRNVANIERYAWNRFYLQMCFFLTFELENEILKWLQFFSLFVFLLLFLSLLGFSEFFSDILGCFPEC